MQLISPEVLQEARGLSTAMTGTILVLGFALWLFGWRWHRFWVVSGLTLVAGLIGLNAGRTVGGTQILAVGILLAVAAGMLGLELARLIAFVGGGCVVWLAVQWVVPQAQELWAVFLSGGLFGILLYRLWMMLLTSFSGVLMAAHAGLVLLEQAFVFEATKLIEHNPAVINGCVVALVVLGIVLQALTATDTAPVNNEASEQKTPKKKAAEDNDETTQADPPTPSWWRRLFKGRAAA
jgi:hypothetical protein